MFHDAAYWTCYENISKNHITEDDSKALQDFHLGDEWTP